MEEVSNLYITTDDGSYKRKGMVTEVIKDLVQNEGKTYDVVVAIGPMIMMKFVCLLTKGTWASYDRQHESYHGRRNRHVRSLPAYRGDEVKFACVDGPEFDGHLVNFDEAMKRQQLYKTEEGRAYLKRERGRYPSRRMRTLRR